MQNPVITLQRLQDYCKKHDIAVPKTATRDQLEAAIARALLHMGQAPADPEIGCFGNWSEHDMNCNFCALEEHCYRSAIGADRKKYTRFIDGIDNPKLRLAKLRKEDPKKKRARKRK
jgi:hypothetical protein